VIANEANGGHFWSRIFARITNEVDVFENVCNHLQRLVLPMSRMSLLRIKSPAAVATLVIPIVIFCVTDSSRAENLLSNPGFENPAIAVGTDSDTHPDKWEIFTGGTPPAVGLSSVSARSDKQSVRFVGQDAPNFFQGMYQDHAATAGKTYHFSVFVQNDVVNPMKGAATGQLSIEWQDAGSGEIKREWGPTWGESLSSTNWMKIEMSATAPANAAKARFVIVEHGGEKPVASGVFLVDDASAEQVP
jgi:hypothetical protein